MCFHMKINHVDFFVALYSHSCYNELEVIPMFLDFLPKSFRLQLDSDNNFQIILNRNEYITFIEDIETSTFYVNYYDDSYITNNAFIQLDRPNNKNNVKKFFGCLNESAVVSAKQQLRFTQYITYGI